MDAKNQLTYFLISLAVGFIGGALYEPFAILRKAFQCDKKQRKTIGTLLDISYFVLFSAWCIVTSQAFRFPDFRVYMWIGWLGGAILYSKTLRRIVAFLEKVCYNMLVKVLKMAKSKEKTLKREDNIDDTR